jgi:DNA polymerase
MNLDAAKTIDELNAIIAQCQKCPLFEGRTHTVPGDGNASADIMFIGEGPGKNEDLQGLPFVGAAGKVLSEMMESIGLTRADAYIANVVKCRPPKNRDPKPEEARQCFSYLEKQVELIDPKLIVTLGRHSMERFLPNMKISEARGMAYTRVIDGLGKRVFFPVYHPAAALYRPQLRQVIIDDFKKVPGLIKDVYETEQ